ncbi:MAG: hypothetical protein FRX49_05909 [Trebouxia sp. A1-2]|nr:MAG: hypothetical protein FRX49_05909 [Trebouxia sp. A1-2]
MQALKPWNDERDTPAAGDLSGFEQEAAASGGLAAEDGAGDEAEAAAAADDGVAGGGAGGRRQTARQKELCSMTISSFCEPAGNIMSGNMHCDACGIKPLGVPLVDSESADWKWLLAALRWNQAGNTIVLVPLILVQFRIQFSHVFFQLVYIYIFIVVVTILIRIIVPLSPGILGCLSWKVAHDVDSLFYMFNRTAGGCGLLGGNDIARACFLTARHSPWSV